MQAAGGIDDEHVGAGIDGLVARFLNQALDCRRIGLNVRAFIDVGLDRLRNDFELLASGGTVNVDRNQQRSMPAILEPIRQFAGGGGLPEPCKPAIRMTVGGWDANFTRAVSRPRVSTSSSRTI